MSFILGFDTSTSHCSVALAYQGKIIFSQNQSLAQGQASLLPLMVQGAFEATKTHQKNLTHVAVTRGPGSFTGIRVGLAFGQGVALAGNKKLLGIPTFYAMAPLMPHTLYLIDTKCGDYYGAYADTNGHLSYDLYKKETIITSPVTQIVADIPLPFKVSQEVTVSPPSAEQLLTYVLSQDETSFFDTSPLYMRAPAIHGQKD